jgi:hypothetical protein
MYGIFPFIGKNCYSTAVAIAKGKRSKLPLDSDQLFSKELKDILNSLLSVV